MPRISLRTLARPTAIGVAVLLLGLLIVRTALRGGSEAEPVSLPDVHVTPDGDMRFEWPVFADAEAYLVLFLDSDQREVARYGPFTDNYFLIRAENLRGVQAGVHTVWRVVGLRDGKQATASAFGAFEAPTR